MHGGAAASLLVRSTPDLAVWVPALAEEIVLCSLTKQDTLLSRCPLPPGLQISTRGVEIYSLSLHAIETWISSSLNGHLALKKSVHNLL